MTIQITDKQILDLMNDEVSRLVQSDCILALHGVSRGLCSDEEALSARQRCAAILNGRGDHQ